ncbi:hypothetical protein MaudMau93_000073 [Microsporum audouinii]
MEASTAPGRLEFLHSPRASAHDNLEQLGKRSMVRCRIAILTMNSAVWSDSGNGVSIDDTLFTTPSDSLFSGIDSVALPVLRETQGPLDPALVGAVDAPTCGCAVSPYMPDASSKNSNQQHLTSWTDTLLSINSKSLDLQRSMTEFSRRCQSLRDSSAYNTTICSLEPTIELVTKFIELLSGPDIEKAYSSLAHGTFNNRANNFLLLSCCMRLLDIIQVFFSCVQNLLAQSRDSGHHVHSITTALRNTIPCIMVGSVSMHNSPRAQTVVFFSFIETLVSTLHDRVAAIPGATGDSSNHPSNSRCCACNSDEMAPLWSKIMENTDTSFQRLAAELKETLAKCNDYFV